MSATRTPPAPDQTQTRFPHWQDIVVYAPDGPQPQFLLDSDQLKVIIVGLNAGQQIPAHPEELAMYHILAGTGSMTVNGQILPVRAGDTVIVHPSEEIEHGTLVETR